MTLYGYAGKILRVNLSTRRITEEAIGEATARQYIGGTGLGARVLYDEVPPEVDWSDEANRVIIASGPLGGTKLPGSGTISITSKGALTNGAANAQANGFFGAYLRLCGYDAIIIQGKAPSLTYLHIREGAAELRDAAHLAGLETRQTEDAIRRELGKTSRQVSVFGIGPAGENLVKFAAICGDHGHVAGHNGLGASMGAKRLKAIAVDRGSKEVPLKDEAAFAELAAENRHILRTEPSERAHYLYGTLPGTYAGAKEATIPIRNYQTNVWRIPPEKLEQFGPDYIRGHFQHRMTPCFGCMMHHCHDLTMTEGKHAGKVFTEPEAEQFAACGPLMDVQDVADTIMLANLIDDLGLENNEAGWVVAFVMECFEKGILTREKCDGLEVRWGDAEAAAELLRRTAFRQGIGDTLADGVRVASQRLGVPEIGVYTLKGDTPRSHDHRSRWVEMFDTCVSNTGTIETHRLVPRQPLGLPKLGNHGTLSPEDTIGHVALTKGTMQFEDSLGICRFTGRMDFAFYNRALKAACGWEMTVEDSLRAGLGAVNLLKAFNLRCGITAEMDAPSPRYGSTPTDGPFQGRSIAPHWDGMRRRYYELMGWDAETGRPTPETLARLGLEDVSEDLRD